MKQMRRSAEAALEPACAGGRSEMLRFEDVYRDSFGFVWRSLRALGVDPAQIDDAVQDTFVVVHRRLSGFEGRSRVETWLFGIARRVASHYRRSATRRRTEPLGSAEPPATEADTPFDLASRTEAGALVLAILDELDEDRRLIFVLVEIEQLTVPEATEILGLNVNTAYSRLRLARRDFEEALQRRRTAWEDPR
jgi:RNA polymerase sigma-70 factor (ECF subfamily)